MIITGILIILCAVFNALMDLSAEDRFKNMNLNKTFSSGNKYKRNPKWLFMTVLVWTTDFWHFCQFMFHNCWQLAIALQTDYWWAYFIGLKVLFSGVFEVVYKSIKRRLMG